MKKSRNILFAMAFMFAIGSAVASEYLVAVNAYSSKDDVPSQATNCVLRGACSGSGVDCQITFDPDGSGPLPVQSAIMRDGKDPQNTRCGDVLKHQ